MLNNNIRQVLIVLSLIHWGKYIRPYTSQRKTLHVTAAVSMLSAARQTGYLAAFLPYDVKTATRKTVLEYGQTELRKRNRGNKE